MKEKSNHFFLMESIVIGGVCRLVSASGRNKCSQSDVRGFKINIMNHEKLSEFDKGN